jgi:Flp pilus assembly protein TadD
LALFSNGCRGVCVAGCHEEPRGTRGWTVGWVAILAVGLSACSVPTSLETPLDSGRYEDILQRQQAGMDIDEEALRELPELTAADYERVGDQYVADGKLGLAFVRYQKSLELDPNRATAGYKMGIVLLKKGSPENAVLHFRSVLQHNPDDPLALMGLGQALAAQRDDDSAETVSRRAVALDPGLAKAHETLGVLADRKGDHEQAIEHYQQALALIPGDGSVLNNLGVSYFMLGRYEDALDVLGQAARRGGEVGLRAANNLGRTYAKLGRWPDAFSAFRRAADEPVAYNNLGLLYLSDGRAEKAVACFEHALASSPRFYERAARNLELAKGALPARGQKVGATCP